MVVPEHVALQEVDVLDVLVSVDALVEELVRNADDGEPQQVVRVLRHEPCKAEHLQGSLRGRGSRVVECARVCVCLCARARVRSLVMSTCEARVRVRA